MDQSPAPQHPDPALQLQRDLYYQAAHALRAALPPPVTNTQEDLDRRDRVAIATVASLCPANAEEVTIAVRYVVAHTHAMDCMRVMRENPGTPAAVKAEAQFRHTARHANGTRSLLLRVQAVRHRREKDNTDREQDAWVDHIALRLMGEALSPAPVAAPPTPMPAPVAEPLSPEPAPVAAPSSPEPALVAAPLSGPAPAAAQPQAEPKPTPPSAPKLTDDAEPSFDLVAEAERYAILYPRRARLIRSLGGLPGACDFGPPEPELVQAIVTGTTPELRALDSPATAAA